MRGKPRCRLLAWHEDVKNCEAFWELPCVSCCLSTRTMWRWRRHPEQVCLSFRSLARPFPSAPFRGDRPIEIERAVRFAL